GLRRQRPDVTYVQMACVNDNPEFLQMVADWAEDQISALLSEQALSVNPALAKVQAEVSHDHGHHSHEPHSHEPHSHDHHNHAHPHAH
ncbi:MAG: hypothetical protein LH679_07935, partial [Cyanobacteria bacterium CAN_BIN43]|nr:hypothetical protein [Cyanobacteria bacterium CAN_BIN43]